MKITPFLVIVVGLSILTCCQVHAQDTNKITTSINFVNVPPDKVLDAYQAMTKLELVVATDVRRATHGITLRFNGSPEAAPQMIERALLKQDGIVITRLGNRRASVTYNDQLELEP
jgi:hypothetical protein